MSKVFGVLGSILHHASNVSRQKGIHPKRPIQRRFTMAKILMYAMILPLNFERPY